MTGSSRPSSPRRTRAQNKYKIDSTPTFIVNGPKEKDGLHPGEMSYDAFAAIIKAAGG